MLSSFRGILRETYLGGIRAALIVALMVPVLAPSARADQQSAGNSGERPETIKLVLHPAPEPKPALRYRLLPGFMDLRPGNAAVIYNKIGMQIAEPVLSKAVDEIDKLTMEEAPEKFAYGKAKEQLATLDQVFKDLELASRRKSCDWELPLRETDNVMAMLLPELQKARAYARLLLVQARVQIKEGRYEEAIGTLRVGYALARHVAEGPTLVNALVGIAISNVMSAELRYLAEQPGAPNLYWALTGLPRPMIDMAKALDAESQLIYLLGPQLKEIDDADRGPAYWDRLLDRLAGTWGDLGGSGRKGQIRLAMTGLALKGYPTARRGLIEWGYSPQRVDAMPVPQVVALYTRRTYEELRDEMFKWFALPYPQAREGLERAERLLKTEGRRREIFPAATLLLPAIGAAHLAGARCDREIAVLRMIEALRLYAASHDGQLPEKLGDVTEVPIPLNPITGQPFGYRKSGNTAVLEAPGPPDKSKRFGLRIEIEMTGEGKEVGTGGNRGE